MTRWVEVLRQIEPDYDLLKKIMEEPPLVVASLEKRKFRWWVRIHEDWTNTPLEHQHAYYTASDSNREDRIKWTEEQLSSWKFVSRQSYDQWAFVRKRDAEKFLTIFNIVWA